MGVCVDGCYYLGIFGTPIDQTFSLDRSRKYFFDWLRNAISLDFGERYRYVLNLD